MIEPPVPLPPGRWAKVPARAPTQLLEQFAALRLQNAALRAQHAVLQVRVHQREARLGLD
jgi:hypothetical protein